MEVVANMLKTSTNNGGHGERLKTSRNKDMPTHNFNRGLRNGLII